MCINRITAWAFGGHNYDTERDAVWAAIDATARKIVKDYSSNPGRGMIESPDLPKLLLRYRELSETDEPTTANSAEGTQGEEPEGTRESAIALVVREMQSLTEQGGRQQAKDWLTTRGFEDVSDFSTRATEDDLENWRLCQRNRRKGEEQ